MKRNYCRSVFYNVMFFGLTGVACVLCLPALLLPRRAAMSVVYAFVYVNLFLERWVLGLRYEIRGAEHLPESGAYIVAAKHQSAYETLKLHVLFKDPAIILKKELLSIPLWGWYLAKSDVIAIDRSSPEAAVESIQNGARRMKEMGRPIVIFPQGTRVAVDVDASVRPYKVGVARVQEATKLPVVPLAMNSGMFWPRNGFWKSSGTVVFEFLKPIKRVKDRRDLLSKLEMRVEDASRVLMDEARVANAAPKPVWKYVVWALVPALLFAGYSALWFEVAARVKAEYLTVMAEVSVDREDFVAPVIGGFPGKLTLRVAREEISGDQGALAFEDLVARSWPFPYMPISVETGAISFRAAGWDEALSFDSLSAEIVPPFSQDGGIVDLRSATLLMDGFMMDLRGVIDLSQEPVPMLDLVLSLKNHEPLLVALQDIGVLDQRMGMFLGSGLTALVDVETGLISIPVYQKQGSIYAGPFAVYKVAQGYQRRVKPVVLE